MSIYLGTLQMRSTVTIHEHERGFCSPSSVSETWTWIGVACKACPLKRLITMPSVTHCGASSILTFITVGLKTPYSTGLRTQLSIVSRPHSTTILALMSVWKEAVQFLPSARTWVGNC